LTPAYGFKILGAASEDFTGISVSGAGDINGDRVNDVIIGANGASPRDRDNAGACYVVYGKPGGLDDVDLLELTPAYGFKILGAESDDWAGNSVSNAGDINSDGVNDIMIGANGASPSGRIYAGVGYVVYGKPGGLVDVDLLNLTPAQGFKILGAERGDLASSSVSNAGDINGDGVNDVILGAHGASPSDRATAGVSYVIYGALPTATRQSTSLALTPPASFEHNLQVGNGNDLLESKGKADLINGLINDDADPNTINYATAGNTHTSQADETM
jgi:hypothetical protein